jgi:hypothetical protein
MELLQQLTSIGAPALALMVAALLWDRNRLLNDLKSERAETKSVADRLIKLAEEMSKDD